MDVFVNRRRHLLALIKQEGSNKQLARRLGMGAGYLSHLKTGRTNIGEKMARRIEEKMGMPRGAMDIAPGEVQQINDLLEVVPREQALNCILNYLPRMEPPQQKAVLEALVGLAQFDDSNK